MEIGRIYEGRYPVGVAAWCNANNAHIKELERNENGERQFQITKNLPPSEARLAELEIARLEAYLIETDWYVVREMDSKAPMPGAVKEKRASARAKISALRYKQEAK
jgi:hypothetical protein